MANWGWAEITGQNSVSPIGRSFSEGINSDNETGGDNTPTRQGHGTEVPQPTPYATDDDNRSLRSLTNTNERPNSAKSAAGSDLESPNAISHAQTINNDGPFSSLVNFFKPNPSPKSHNHDPKHNKIYKRSQTLRVDSDSSTPSIQKQPSSPRKPSRGRNKATTGDSEQEDPERLSAPPKTTFFESAGDLLKPPLPSVEFLINPESRSRTIFHDRVYHPSDIPPPPLKKRPTGSLMSRRRSTSNVSSSDAPNPSVPHTESNLSTRDYDDLKNTNPDRDPRDVIDGSAMKVEEKIARAYHRDLSWRKVLVRLEPDAHNNMIVRRMFANAYGWPVIKHLCDTHFSDSAEAITPDEDETNEERAKGENEGPDKEGGETNEPQRMLSREDRTDSEVREATDEVPALKKPGSLGKALATKGKERQTYERTGTDSEAWSERDWADSGDDSEDEEAQKKSSGEGERKWNWTEAIAGRGATSPKGTEKKELDAFLGKGSQDEHHRQLESDAAAARVLSGEAAGMGIGLGQMHPDEDVGKKL
jgi:hypothetical protein